MGDAVASEVTGTTTSEIADMETLGISGEVAEFSTLSEPRPSWSVPNCLGVLGRSCSTASPFGGCAVFDGPEFWMVCNVPRRESVAASLAVKLSVLLL